MSNPAASEPALPPLDPKIGLMFTIADHLIPLFKTGSIDTPLARRMAVSAIEAYQPETRADYVNVARTIAFSIAALALLGKAVSEGMTTQDQMKAFGRANALNGSADRSERTMMQRRRCQHAHPYVENPGHASEPPAFDPLAYDPQFDDAEIQAAVAEAMAEHKAARQPSNPKPEPVPEAATPLTSIQPPIEIPPAAIHQHSQPKPPPFKADLLRNSAIQRVVAQNAGQNPWPVGTGRVPTRADPTEHRSVAGD